MPERYPEPRPELLEVVCPRTNAAGLAAAEQLSASLSLPPPFSLEIAAHAGERWFLARGIPHFIEGYKGVRIDPQAAVAWQ